MEFNFKNVRLNLLDRCGYAHFLGWLNKIPTFIASEDEIERKWESLPIIVKLFLHIDAKDKKSINFCVLNSKQFIEEHSESGTLNLIDVENAKKEFWGGGS